MFDVVVVAHDGSERSALALPYATWLAKQAGTPLVIFHARTHAVESDTEVGLRLLLSDISTGEVPVELEIRDALIGNEAEAIAEFAREREAGVIVLASRGRGPLAGATLGSVAQRLPHVAPCPVLVVPAHPVGVQAAAGSGAAGATR